MPDAERETGKRSLMQRLRRPLSGTAGVIVAILFVKGCIVDQYNIPSDSMAPTLVGDGRFFHDDRVLVNKWWLGPRIPFTHFRLWEWNELNRWDIVVFEAPEGTSPHKRMIKRVVGLPGERIFLYNGHVFVNGEAVDMPEEFILFYYYSDHDFRREVRIADSEERRKYWQALADTMGKAMRYGLLEDEEYHLMEEAEKRELSEEEIRAVHGGNLNLLGDEQYVVVPEDCYFLLGDKSIVSWDSRMIGWVPRDNILGPVIAVWWPWDHRKDFTGFTHTWWGILLIYVLPALFVLYETAQTARGLYRWRRNRRNAA